MNSSLERGDLTAVILAGGRATRLGGVDKGLHGLHGRPLIEYALEKLLPQAGTILINCNRNEETYRAYGHPLISDRLTDFPGPLAGLHAALHTVTTPLLLTVPCDTPNFPCDLVQRLYAALNNASASYACTPEAQPVFALYRTDLLPLLDVFLASGQRGVGRWLNFIAASQADFSDHPAAFHNLNSADDWP